MATSTTELRQCAVAAIAAGPSQNLVVSGLTNYRAFVERLVSGSTSGLGDRKPAFFAGFLFPSSERSIM
jgi:hypothetical protein